MNDLGIRALVHDRPPRPLLPASVAIGPVSRSQSCSWSPGWVGWCSWIGCREASAGPSRPNTSSRSEWQRPLGPSRECARMGWFASR